MGFTASFVCTTDAGEMHVCRMIAHQATLRAVLGHFCGTDPDDVPHASVPLHTVLQLCVRFEPKTGRRLSSTLRPLLVDKHGQ